jgi:hypothetical protein
MFCRNHEVVSSKHDPLYVALNPVRARLAKRAVDWQWSSVHDQLSRKRSGGLTDTAPVRERFPDFAALIERARKLEKKLER